MHGTHGKCLANSSSSQARHPRPHVRPEWIVDSIRAGHVLPIEGYVLYRPGDAPGQRRLADFVRLAPGVLPEGAIYGSAAGLVGGAALGDASAAAQQQQQQQHVRSIPQQQQVRSIPKQQHQHQQLQQQQQQPRSPASEMAAAHALAARLRAACDVLKGPVRSFRDDPDNFLDSFFRSSRLHFIGSWKPRVEAVLAAAPPGAPAPCPPGPGQPRTIIHLDQDCFFASGQT